MFRHLLTELAREGKMIFYSSHVLEVVEKICARVVILHRGHVVAYESVERLRQLRSLPSLEAVFSELVMQEDVTQTAADIVRAMRTPAVMAC